MVTLASGKRPVAQRLGDPAELAVPPPAARSAGTLPLLARADAVATMARSATVTGTLAVTRTAALTRTLAVTRTAALTRTVAVTGLTSPGSSPGPILCE